MNPGNYNLIARHAALLIIGGLVAMLGNSSAHAGTIVPWHDHSAVRAPDLDFEIAGDAGCCTQEPVAKHESEPRESPERDLNVIDALQQLAQSTGGATPPASSVVSVGDPTVGITVESLPAPLSVCAFSYLREASVHLPHPPLDDLLDPPKAAA